MLSNSQRRMVHDCLTKYAILSDMYTGSCDVSIFTAIVDADSHLPYLTPVPTLANTTIHKWLFEDLTFVEELEAISGVRITFDLDTNTIYFSNGSSIKVVNKK